MGLIKSAEVTRKVTRLKATYRFVNDVKSEIRYSKREVAAIISELYKKEEYKILCKNEQSMQKGSCTLLEKFGMGLGKSDTIGQMEYCDAYLKTVSDELDSAKEEASQKSKLYTALGCLLGVAITVIIY